MAAPMAGYFRIITWTIAAFYMYGAGEHVANMLSLTGFDWPAAPLKWQALDVIYLILDVAVVVGLVKGWRIGYVAFFTAAFSQIVLYTVLRAWVLEVPAAFRPSPEQAAYLDTLVGFHIVTVLLMLVALWFSRRDYAGRDPS